MKKKLSKKSRAIFMDRDGVINEILFHQEMGILETPFTVKQFKLLPRVGKAIYKINQSGFKALVASNQPGIAMRHFSRKTLHAITNHMLSLLEKDKARLDGIYYCLCHPTKGYGKLRKNCSCRKPKAGLLKNAAKDFGLDLKKSYMIGDSILDVQAGRRAGCKTVLVAHLKCDLCLLMEKKGIKPHYRAKNLYEAVRLIQRLEKKK